ncbi:hypothetical protein B0H14DRAFT_2684341 [Mycena olivaceomarginata]|nr:hypothetical protein B0H14DRAFT_2684341 [Mycena olivaceomarginata]
MVLSSPSLAVECRRWKERGKDIVPREWRKCRFCEVAVEDPAHAMFICDNPDLMEVRETFLRELYSKIPEFKGAFTDVMDLFKTVLGGEKLPQDLGNLPSTSLKYMIPHRCCYWNHRARFNRPRGEKQRRWH